MQGLKDFWDGVEPNTRLLLSPLLVFCAVIALPLHISVALLLLCAALLALWLYLRHGGVWSAFRAFRAGRMYDVEKFVMQIHWPKLLNATSQAYYYWLRGVVEMVEGRFAAARVFLLLSACGALKTENDRALVQCLLAEVSLQLGEKDVAADHLQLANKLAHHPDAVAIMQSLHKRMHGQEPPAP